MDIIAPIYWAFSDKIEIQNPKMLPNKKPPKIKLRKYIPKIFKESLFKSPNQ